MKPIIFSTEMVQAILEGRKTQVRLVVKPQAILNEGFWRWHGAGWSDDIKRITPVPGHSMYNRAPYNPGDILWVKETWRIGAWNEDIQSIAVDYKAGRFVRREWLHIEDEKMFKRYRVQSIEDAIATGLEPNAANRQYRWKPGEAPTRWRSSIHMPRMIARLFLEVQNVRVERLQEITADDIRAEGTPDTPHESNCLIAERQSFRELWDSIYGKRGWDTNPWVWVIEFKEIQ